MTRLFYQNKLVLDNSGQRRPLLGISRCYVDRTGDKNVCKRGEDIINCKLNLFSATPRNLRKKGIINSI